MSDPFEPYFVPGRPMPDWENQNALQRVKKSVALLSRWELLTPPERARIDKRIETWYKLSPPADQPCDIASEL